MQVEKYPTNLIDSDRNTVNINENLQKNFASYENECHKLWQSGCC